MSEAKTAASSSGKASSQEPIRLLVLQLGRMGDTLRSMMALRAAKQLYPQLEIHFVCRERFSSAAKRIPWLASVHVLPTDRILGGVQEGQKSEAEALSDLARWIGPLVAKAWDIQINWSYSEVSSWLAGILPSRVKLGYSRRRDGTLSCADGWSHYIQAIVQGGYDQNIHLTDILTTQLLTALQIHVGEPIDNGDAPVTSKTFFKLELSEGDPSLSWKDPTRKSIAIQLGTGQANKAWNPQHWAQVASLILNRHPETRIVLLGESHDRGREADFMEAIAGKIPDARNLISLVGKTTFDQWASAVSRSQWLLSGVTAVIHLASVLGTRVLNVSTGPVRFAETGPYGNGHYVIAPVQACEACTKRSQNRSQHSCYTDITPEAVYATWSYASTEWAHRRQISIDTHFGQMGFAEKLSQVKIVRAKIRNTQNGGGVVYEPLIKRPLRVNEWMSQVLGHTARAWYCGWTPAVGQELDRSVIGPTLLQSLRAISESADVMAKICEEGKRTAGTLHQKSTKLRSDKLMGLAERTEIQELGKKLLDLDGLLTRLANAQDALAPFAQMSRVLMHNLNGDAIADLSRETAECYQQLGQGSAILNDWIKKTLGLVKPMAVSASTEAKQL